MKRKIQTEFIYHLLIKNRINLFKCKVQLMQNSSEFSFSIHHTYSESALKTNLEKYIQFILKVQTRLP